MALKRAFVPGAKPGKSRIMGSGTRSPVIGRIKNTSGKNRRMR